MNELLEIDDLHVRFHTEDGTVHALNGINLSIGRDEVVGIIGESGCGKSVTALSVMKLLSTPPAEVVRGSIRYDGRDLLELSDSEMNEIRGNDISMIYQDPMSSLNPVLKIGYQITEGLLSHRDIAEAEARSRAVDMLDACGIGDAERIMDEYPHELSGGMRQRVMIAMALITEPELLIADEPTTALDVTIQAQILDLLRDLQSEHETSMIFITHDLPAVSEIADRIAVMYAGNVVESCQIESLFENPLHPYTRKLTESIPKLGSATGDLPSIDGTVPSMLDPPQGCMFADRCPQYIGGECNDVDPELEPVESVAEHRVACHLYTEVSGETPPWDVESDSTTRDTTRTTTGEKS
jgi:oligopeptide/dipeptide ABC transporter ATP-binding protein